MSTALIILISFWTGACVGFLLCALLTAGKLADARQDTSQRDRDGDGAGHGVGLAGAPEAASRKCEEIAGRA